MTESSDSFQTAQPPAPSREQPGRPRRGRRILLVGAIAAVVVAGLGVGAWWAITNYSDLNDTRADLQATQGELAALQQQSSAQSDQITQLESQAAGLQTDLDGRTTELTGLQAEHTQLVSDHEQLVADDAALTTANTGLRGAIDSMALDLTTSRELAAMMAVFLPITGSYNRELADPAAGFLDELATAVGWYDTAEGYHTHTELVRSRLVSAMEDFDPALAEAFQRYMDAPTNSQAEAAFLEWMTLFYLGNLDVIDQALQTGETALAE
jgi:cell division protein FtsB